MNMNDNTASIKISKNSCNNINLSHSLAELFLFFSSSLRCKNVITNMMLLLMDKVTFTYLIFMAAELSDLRLYIVLYSPVAYNFLRLQEREKSSQFFMPPRFSSFDRTVQVSQYTTA